MEVRLQNDIRVALEDGQVKGWIRTIIQLLNDNRET